MTNEQILNSINELNNTLKTIPADHRYSYAVGFLEGILGVITGVEINIDFKGEENE